MTEHVQCLNCHSDTEPTYTDSFEGPFLDGYICHGCGNWYPSPKVEEVERGG